MSRIPRIPLTALLLALCGVVGAQSIKLNGPLPSRVVGRVLDVKLTPDGSRALYAANSPQGLLTPELSSVRTDGSEAPVRLTRILPGAEAGQFELTPDGQQVVHEIAYSLEPYWAALYRSPVDGTSAPVRITPLIPWAKPLRFRLTPDGRRVVYEALNVLWVVPVAGGVAPFELARPSTPQKFIFEFSISPDGRHVVYYDESTDYSSGALRRAELYGVPIDGSAAPEPLTRFSPTALLGTCSVSADGWVVFLATVAGRSRLYSVPVTGGRRPLGLSGPGAYVGSFALSSGPDGGRVIYLGRELGEPGTSLYSVPWRASARAQRDSDLRAGPAPRRIRLSGPLVAGGNVQTFAVGQDGTRVVYSADQESDGRVELFEVPSAGGRLPRKLNAPLSAGGNVVAYDFGPDGEQVLYRADGDSDEVFELYAAPLRGDPAATRLNGTLVNGGDVLRWTVSADGSRLVYEADQAVDGQNELWSAATNGSSPARRLGVEQADRVLLMASGERALFTRSGDPEPSGGAGLFSVPSEGSSSAVRISGPMARSIAGEVSMMVPPRGQHVVYRSGDLFSVDTRRPGVTERLGGPWSNGAFAFTPDGKDLVVQPSWYELDVVPLDGSAPARTLNHVLGNRDRIVGLRLTPDGSRAVYRIFDYATDAPDELYSVRLDGSQPPVRLDGPTVLFVEIGEDFEISPDGRWVVYTADRFADGVPELFVVPVDGRAPALRLDPGRAVTGFDVTSDASRVVHSGSGELFVVPLDGNGSALRLAPAGGRFQIAPDLGHVAYLERGELFAVSLAGSAPPQRLDDVSTSVGAVLDFAFDASGTRVVYRADQTLDHVPELRSVRVDGSQTPVALHPTMPVRRVEGDYRVSAATGEVFYRALAPWGVWELFRVPVDGRSPPRRVNVPLPRGCRVESFLLSPSRVAYIADQESAGVFELFSVALDGRRGPRKENGALAFLGRVRRAHFAPDGERLYYLADEDVHGAVELYMSLLEAPASAPR